MKKIILSVALLTVAAIAFTGCSAKKKDGTSNQTGNVTNSESVAFVYEKITSEKAKERMEGSEDFILLDVRTQEEYNTGHIAGAILIPDYEIERKAEELLEDKSTTILVYCRSGRRSALAAQTLNNLGYTSVYDFGGIQDWPYDIIVE